MADVIRTLTEVLALLADNTKGEISPQDIRDAIVSLAPDHGASHAPGGLGQPLPQNTWTEINSGLQLIAGAKNFTVVDGRLRYTGVAKRRVQLMAWVQWRPSLTNPADITVRLSKNGSAPVDGSQVTTFWEVADAQNRNLPLFGQVDMVTNDFITVEAFTAEAGPQSIATHSLTLNAIALPALA